MPKEPMDHVRSMKKPVVRAVRIITDSEVGEEYNRLNDQVKRLEIREAASNNSAITEQLTAARKQLAEQAKLVEENSILFKFRSISRRRMNDLQEANPPTAKQKQEFEEEIEGTDIKAKLSFNPDTFPKELITECLHEPQLDKDEFRAWLDSDDWNDAELEDMFRAAMEANTTRQVIELGKG